ncbi:fatty acid--CoA ligase family protein [Pseudohaliea sp.]|uniref:ANL family adenylate-forming protein n=1 Tax=Pseudohaliea sp. TaxID=2740289 RepID=UPI0032EDA3D7
MGLLSTLARRWERVEHPFLIHVDRELRFSDLQDSPIIDLNQLHTGSVVALIGDFDPQTIGTFLRLIELGMIIVPLTEATSAQHDYFLEAALVDVVIGGNSIRRRTHGRRHALIDKLRESGHAGLILFSTGTTGRPKAILHDLTLFLRRFETPRPTLRTLSFLVFDHVGGLNTLLHTLFNQGVVIAPASRSVEEVLELCERHAVEALPTTPTFLRLMLMSGMVPDRVPKSLKVVTYGTERMDQPTLDRLCALLPDVDFRQTFGMSELGILRVKSRARDSLFMKIGGEGVRTRVVDDVLEIHSEARMLGYLNAPSPFDAEGWYNTGDLVKEDEGYYRIVGRRTEVINVGGLKFMASDVERVALQFDGVQFAKAFARQNPVTGEHVELFIQAANGCRVDVAELSNFLKGKLPRHQVPRRVRVAGFAIGHRFKRH